MGMVSIPLSLSREIGFYINCCVAMLQIIFLVYHILTCRLRVKFQELSASWFQFNITTTSFLSILSAIITCIFRLLVILDLYCFWTFKATIISALMHKTFLYMFITLRAQVNLQLIPRFVFIITWILFIGFEVSILCAIIIVPLHCIYFGNSARVLVTIYGIGDVIICVWCLLLFVLPINKVLRQQHINETEIVNDSIPQLIQRVKFWTIIALVSTLITVIAVIFINNSAILFFPLDSVINVFSIIKQFKPVKLSWKNCLCFTLTESKHDNIVRTAPPSICVTASNSKELSSRPQLVGNKSSSADTYSNSESPNGSPNNGSPHGSPHGSPSRNRVFFHKPNFSGNHLYPMKALSLEIESTQSAK